MTPSARAVAASLALLAACARPGTTVPADADAKLDSVNARLAQAYRERDPRLYGALWSDSGVFEWPATPPVRGPAALSAMANDIWTGERDVELRVHVAARRLAADHATEWGAFEQTWTDSAGKRSTEYGRYVSSFVRRPDGEWRLDRWLGFEDSTRAAR